MNSKSLHGDCREKLKEIEDNSIDSIVTDPPYELGFMGKKWDNTGIAYNIEVWKASLRVLKLGGHLLSFGGSRTYHRMACAIEDAGFEIRDQIMWIYGSGFPKSLNVSKAIDSKLNAEREVIGTVRRWGNAAGKGRGGQYMNEYEESIGGNEKFDAITASATKEAQQWEGWGTALKPAHEPIVVARKPIEGTVANNALTYGTGGINIDGCLISTTESWARDTTKDKSPITTGDIYN
jgi:site-specific DNA-methyltransferase (adenine-specific)